MRSIRESIIGRKGIEIWPNPYHLTKKDATGKIKNWPLEIITLALKEMELQHLQYPERDLAYLQKNGPLAYLQKNGPFMCFAWKSTKDGHFFWLAINNGLFDRFYDEYTPEKLKQRLEE